MTTEPEDIESEEEEADDDFEGELLPAGATYVPGTLQSLIELTGAVAVEALPEGGVFLYLIGKGRVDLAEWCKTYKPERVAKLGLVP